MHQLTNQVKLLQKAIVTVGDEFLILKRAGDAVTRAHKWDLPGGNSEWPVAPADFSDENIVNPHQADLIREIEEETGISLQANQITSQPAHFSTYFEPTKQLFTVIAGWLVVLPAKPNIVLSHEHTEFVWITLDQFDQYDFGFAGTPDGFIRRMLSALIDVEKS